MSKDDDLWEDWAQMSDAAIQREMDELDRQLEAAQAVIDKLPILNQVAHYRTNILRDILNNRRRAHSNESALKMFNEHWRKSIRRNQIRLLKLRIWRTTGVYPGQA